MSRETGTRPDGVTQAQVAIEFARQADRLSHLPAQDKESQNTTAIEAQFVTPGDPVIVTAEGTRLPAVPLKETHKLNALKGELENREENGHAHNSEKTVENLSGTTRRKPELGISSHINGKTLQKATTDGSISRSTPPSHTNPLFPPLPLYGPPSILRDVQCATFKVSSFFLSAGFLGVIVLGAFFTSIPDILSRIVKRVTFRNPDACRPFCEEEIRRQNLRNEKDRLWHLRHSEALKGSDIKYIAAEDGYIPTEGGQDPLVCDVAYYARRVGLDMEEFHVQTEDGFVIDLWHIYDPKDYTRLGARERAHRSPDLFTGEKRERSKEGSQKRKFPVLMIHGLLQSAGAYCTNDDHSLAFYLCKSGYDVWLGNNRCGFNPKHVRLNYSDPRMWCWNIRQMGVLDLPALTSRVLYETGFDKIGLICHSQGTTQTFVALAKEQRPELGEKLTVFCALAPAAYAGPLIGKMYFKFMRVISPAFFRLFFGIHAFIPIMSTMHRKLPSKVYGWLGYQVFSFLFDWTDTRWDRGLRDRMFQFAPVYVSAESMRWWLGRECFAKHKCILSTKEESHAEDWEDETATTTSQQAASLDSGSSLKSQHKRKPKGATAWYNDQVPPFALWVAGTDDLVDGHKLLHRFQHGREPHVQVVHSKVIPEYEHLDVIWAMDAEDQVFSEVREVLWKTCDARDRCRMPTGCENVPVWTPRSRRSSGLGEEEVELSSSSESSST